VTESELRKIFANNLKYYRTSHNPKFTQEQLSELLDKNKNYIGLLEKEKTSLPLDMIAKLAEILEISPSKLLETNSCPVNSINFNKEDFIDTLCKNLSEKIKKDFTSELNKIIS